MSSSMPIAIIGMAGRFPDAADLSRFWRNLEHGMESLMEISDEELIGSGVSSELLRNPNYVKKGTPLEGADLFDAAFFGINPREAEILDPQHRIFLECAWEAMEDAGYRGEVVPSAVGVYAGAAMNSYLHVLLQNRRAIETAGSYQVMIGNDKDFLATRVSYKLNLKGPSLTVQTACSTSLIAVQLACQSLQAGQCEMALAGGVALWFPQKAGYLYAEGMIFSPDGHCRPFDREGQGIRAGSGAGVVVLKRLDHALRDGDTIRAVILGAAANNDGAAKMGYTAPSIEGQAAAISSALAMAGVNADSITYLEAHGTGTKVGDPIEIAALQRVYGEHTAKKQFCAIGSLKSNIGHLDAAAGVAGLIKTVLTLQHQRIPPSLNYREPNPQIDFANSPFYVNDRLRPWQTEGKPRRAAVSSFGIGGTNVHVILEEAPPQPPPAVRWPAQLLLLSARSAGALDAVTHRMADHLAGNPSVSLADACYTTQVGRKRFAHRRALVCSSREEAIRELIGSDSVKLVETWQESSGRPVVFMFSGQGSQYVGMGRGLYETQPVFRESMDRCADSLASDLGCDFRETLYSSAADPALLNQTSMAQPAIFAIEYSLALLWMSWGVLPETMIGHSIGEYVAACLAGVFSLEDGLRLVAARGRMMQRLPSGGMLAVQLSPDEVRTHMNGHLSLAAINAPSFCTVAGPQEDIADLRALLESRGIGCRQLHTSHAFHSLMMDGALEPFRRYVRTIPLSEPRLPFISNLTGRWILPSEATDPSYWAQHLRQTIRFADGIHELAAESSRIFLEIGPGHTLISFARESTRSGGSTEAVATLRHPNDPQPDTTFVLNAVGQLWLAGADINWIGLHRGERLHRVPLPAYPFERQRFWVEPEVGAEPAKAPSLAAGQASIAALPEERPLVPARHARPAVSSSYAAPENEAQRILTDIWEEMLGIEPIGADDNFFAFGGHSLLATGVLSRVRDAFGVALPLRTIFDAPTIRQLSDQIETLAWAAAQHSAPAEEAGDREEVEL